MGKRYYEHKDIFSGKKFYSDDPYDWRADNETGYHPATPLEALICSIFTLTICPLCLRLIRFICFEFESMPFWLGAIIYIILFVIICFFTCSRGLLTQAYEDNLTLIPKRVLVTYIISLIIIFLFPSADPPIIEWCDYAMTGYFAIILAYGFDEAANILNIIKFPRAIIRKFRHP